MRKMRAGEVAGAASVLRGIHERNPDDVAAFLDDGLRVNVEPGRGKNRTYEVICGSCGTRLVVAAITDDQQRSRDLALRNLARNPCCERWQRG